MMNRDLSRTALCDERGETIPVKNDVPFALHSIKLVSIYGLNELQKPFFQWNHADFMFLISVWTLFYERKPIGSLILIARCQLRLRLT